MLQVNYWKAFDGKLFTSEEDCHAYESQHPFLDKKQIVFYSNEGRIIENPDEQVLIDSNAFEVFDREAFTLYVQFRKELKLKEPKDSTLDFPRHYCFMNNKWVCVEEELKRWMDILHSSFTKEVVEDDKERHDLLGDADGQF